MNISEQLILSDFNRFLDYVVQNPSLNLTKDKCVLRSKDLMAINDRLHFKAPMVTPKSQQKAYGVISAFFYISTASQIVFVKENIDKGVVELLVNEAKIREYDALTDAEKYFSLLEAFWCYIDWDVAFDCRSFYDNEFYTKLIKYPEGKLVTIEDRELKRKGALRGPSHINIAEVFEAFGLFTMVWDENLDKRPSSYRFPYATVTPLAWGKALLPILLEKRPAYIWHNLDPFQDDRAYDLSDYEDEEDEEMPSLFASFLKGDINQTIEGDDDDDDDDDDENDTIEGNFADVFMPVLEGQKIEKSLFPLKREMVKGTYLIKVALGKDLYRVLSVGSEHTFQDLHWAIQKAYKFDDDHLYTFYMNGNDRAQTGDRFADPRGLAYGLDGQKPANAFMVGEAGLWVGKQFTYLFDYGHSWYFYITVLSIEVGNKEPKAIKVIETKGKAPKQYSYDDDDDD
jgi:hypothetical protein